MPASLERVAEGVTRVTQNGINWYLVEDRGAFSVVDAGLGGHWPLLEQAIAAAGRRLGDLKAVLLTHAHGDHVGFAEQARQAGATVWVHPGDAAMARGEVRQAFPKPILYNLWKPRVLRSFVTMARENAGGPPRPVAATEPLIDGATLDVPGRPRALHLPGHTAGSCAFLLPGQGLLFSGDALVTYDLLTNHRGPQLSPQGFNADVAQAREALERLRPLDAATLLPGHGTPWTGPLTNAVSLARRG